MMAWLLASALAAASVLDGITLEQLEAKALDHPLMDMREAEIDRARLGIRAEELTPVKGLNVGTGLVQQEDGTGVRLGATLWLSVSVTDLILYRNRMRKARAGHRSAESLKEAEGMVLRGQVRDAWNLLRQLEDELLLLEDAVANLEVLAKVGHQMFLSGQLDLDQLTAVENQLLTARQRRTQTRGAFETAISKLELLVGATLAEIREGAQP